MGRLGPCKLLYPKIRAKLRGRIIARCVIAAAIYTSRRARMKFTTPVITRTPPAKRCAFARVPTGNRDETGRINRVRRRSVADVIACPVAPGNSPKDRPVPPLFRHFSSFLQFFRPPRQRNLSFELGVRSIRYLRGRRV